MTSSDLVSVLGRPCARGCGPGTARGRACEAGDRAGTIVEVEAYEGADDAASHAHRGPTDRNRVMFGPPARLYVYRIYGIHWCANVVCGPEDSPGAVLIRAIEPVDGIDAMWADRPKATRPLDLGSGPGKLCAALGIDGTHNGVDLLDRSAPVRLGPGWTPARDAVVAGPRIGISKATERPWRFAVAGNGNVSRPRPPGFGPVPPTGDPGPGEPIRSTEGR